jgi:hypothetical protein
MRALVVIGMLAALGCTTPRLTSTCSAVSAKTVGPVYDAWGRHKGEGLQDGDVRAARVALEETRRALWLTVCDARDRGAVKFKKIQADFEAAEALVVKMESAKGVVWDAEVAERDLEAAFDLEWRTADEGRRLTAEEEERL